jgi:hypothetical protein
MSAKHSVDVAEPSPSSQLLLVVHVTMQRAPVSARIMLRNVTRHSRARADLLDRLAPSLSGGFNLGASDPQCCDLICLWSGAPFLSVICQAHRRPRVLSTDGLELQVARRVRTAAASPAAPVRNGRSRSGRPSRRAAARRCRRGPSDRGSLRARSNDVRDGEHRLDVSPMLSWQAPAIVAGQPQHGNGGIWGDRHPFLNNNRPRALPEAASSVMRHDSSIP